MFWKGFENMNLSVLLEPWKDACSVSSHSLAIFLWSSSMDFAVKKNGALSSSRTEYMIWETADCFEWGIEHTFMDTRYPMESELYRW